MRLESCGARFFKLSDMVFSLTLVSKEFLPPAKVHGAARHTIDRERWMGGHRYYVKIRRLSKTFHRDGTSDSSSR